MKMSMILLVVGLLTTLLVIHACSSISYNKDEDRRKRIESSPFYKDGKFRNFIPWSQLSVSENISIAWDFITTDNNRKPSGALPRQMVNPIHFNTSERKQFNVTWLGHSSLMININGYRVLTDPVFEKSVSIVGPKRFNGDVPLELEALDEIDVVVISHNHYDHLNHYSIKALKERTKRFIVPLGVGCRLEKLGIPAKKITEMDWWEEFNVDENLMFVATPAQHFSGRGLFDKDETLWASWVIKSGNHRLFFSGDSGYFNGFKQIGDKYGPFDMTFIECGAYNEKWHHVHMYPEETVQAHVDLKGKILHPIHWATFDLSLHSWFEPMERLTTAARIAGVATATPVVGDTTIYGSYIPNEKWWVVESETENKQPELRLKQAHLNTE